MIPPSPTQSYGSRGRCDFNSDQPSENIFIKLNYSLLGPGVGYPLRPHHSHESPRIRAFQEQTWHA